MNVILNNDEVRNLLYNYIFQAKTFEMTPKFDKT